MRLLISVDTETTGLPRDRNVRALQLGAVAYDMHTLKELGEFRCLINPGIWASSYPRAEEVHGLTREHVEANGKNAKEAWGLFNRWCTDMTNNNGAEQLYMGAWSSKFDREMIRRLRQDATGSLAPLPQWPMFMQGAQKAINGCFQTAFRSWTMTQPTVRTPRYGALKFALATLNLPNQSDQHDAVEDARLAAQVWAEMVRRHRAATALDRRGRPLVTVLAIDSLPS